MAKNVFDKSVYGVGYLGQGEYKSRGEDGKKTKAYTIWSSMLQRCYNANFHIKHPTYKDCSVCPEWHNYQNFASWFEANYREGFALDKDLLSPSKVYSPETCVFVPQCINNLLLDAKAKRGEYKQGVSWHKRDNRFIAYLNIKGKTKHLGYFSTELEAYQAYKIAKQCYIIEVLKESWLKGEINEKLGWAIIDRAKEQLV